jgi:ACS family pantothenate transporter-like MFS transporter
MTGKIDAAVIKESLKNWKFWLLVPFNIFYSLEAVTGRNFGVYLKAYGYSVSDRNTLPATSSIITIFCLIGYSYISDRTVKYGRGWWIGVVLIWATLPNAVLAFWPNSNSIRVAAFLANGTTYVTPIFYAWVADICSVGHMDTTQRAFITGCITGGWYA